jgi:P27 family predicted phage terminase small subunit
MGRGQGGGPKPKPTRLKILSGNPGRRPLNNREPVVEPCVALCPDDLTPEGKEVWDAIGGQLAACGILTQVDAVAFEMLVRAYMEWKQAAAAIAKSGPVWLEAGEGRIPKFAYSPYWVQSNKAQTRLLAVLREFGMTPSARSSIKSAAPLVETISDPAARYFA